jgi:hypothetical protein
LIGFCQAPVVTALFKLFTSTSMAQQPDPDRLNTRALEAAVSFAQSLAQWEFVLIGSSLLVLVGTSHRRPASRWLRCFYLLFLPGWLSLARSIYLGARAQGAYLAYLLVPVTTLQLATQKLNEDIGNEVFWMLWGLAIFFIWLLLYLLWWIFSTSDTEGKSGI